MTDKADVEQGRRQDWRGPVTGALRRWSARPDVLADPEQREGGRVWTTAADVLGRQLRSGDEVVAAWGDLTWEATVDDAPPGGGELWLRPATPVLTVPAVSDVHPVRELTTALIAAIGVSTPPERALEVQARVAQVLSPLLADFEGAVDSFEAEVRGTRELARRVLRELRAGDPPKRVRRLLKGPVGDELRQVARLSRRPPIGR